MSKERQAHRARAKGAFLRAGKSLGKPSSLVSGEGGRGAEGEPCCGIAGRNKEPNRCLLLPLPYISVSKSCSVKGCLNKHIFILMIVLPAPCRRRGPGGPPGCPPPPPPGSRRGAFIDPKPQNPNS